MAVAAAASLVTTSMFVTPAADAAPQMPAAEAAPQITVAEAAPQITVAEAALQAPAAGYNSPGMRRVPRPRSTMAPPVRRSGPTLQWRTSPHVAATRPQPEPARSVSLGESATSNASSTATATPSIASPVAAPVQRGVQPAVRHVAFNHDHDQSQMRREAAASIAVAQFTLPGDDPSPMPPSDGNRSLRQDSPQNSPQNSLRSLFEDSPADADAGPQPMPLPRSQAERLQPPADAFGQPRGTGRSADDFDSPLGDMMRDNTPRRSLDDATDDRLPPLPESPSDLEAEMLPVPDDFENPFDDDLSDTGPEGTRSRGTRDPMNTDGERDDGLGLGDAEPDDAAFDMDDEPQGDDNQLTCEEFRRRIAVQTIDQVSLDISPPYRPDEINLTKYEKLKAKFDAAQPQRTFRNIAGVPLATGRFRDLAYGQVVLETDRGETRLQVNELSEGDLAYITDSFGLPTECLLEQQPVLPRSWTPLTFTWRASNLCHNPLYFQDVNLERYGHSHGPIAEPLVQTAHFFGSVLVLPYKMGVHHPRECVYTLGYYRPGNCAPWILPPVPISARGILNQAAVMTAGTLLIP